MIQTRRHHLGDNIRAYVQLTKFSAQLRFHRFLPTVHKITHLKLLDSGFGIIVGLLLHLCLSEVLAVFILRHTETFYQLFGMLSMSLWWLLTDRNTEHDIRRHIHLSAELQQIGSEPSVSIHHRPDTHSQWRQISSSSSSNFIPNRKQSTAYMSKYTSVNQYTLMFCWWSPEKPMAYLAGNRKRVAAIGCPPMQRTRSMDS